MERWIWRKFEFVLPDDWEMLQFSRNPASGKCAFADRAQFRFEVNWRQVTGAPDFDRMISDYMHNLIEHGMTDGRRVSSGQWTGLEGRVDGRMMSRFGWYSTKEACVVEVIFLWPSVPDKRLEGDVLGSFRDSLPDDQGRIRWRAFGLDVAVPEGWSLDHCRMEPACAQMIFKHKLNRRGEARFSRRGMIDEWLRDPVGKWLASSAAEMLEDMQPPAEEGVGVHRRVMIKGSHRLPFGRKQPGFAQGWVCPRDGRLYSLVAHGVSGLSREVKMECCDEA